MKQFRRKLFGITYFCIFFLCLEIRPVQAYVDPSVMTYAVQAIAGIAITLGTFASLYSRRLMKLFGKKNPLGTHSIRSDDLYFNDPQTHTTVHALSFLSEDTKARLIKQEETKAEKASHPSPRTGLLLTAAISFMWMFYAPLQLYLNNINEFRFDFYSILPALCLMLAAGLVTGTVVYALCYRISKKLYVGMVLFGLIFLVATYIQGNFLAGSLPALDGTKFNWSQYSAERIQSLILWITVLLLVIVLYVKYHKHGFLRGVNIACRILLLTLAITLLINGMSKGGFRRKESAIVSTDHEFTFSSNQNLIILVLDALDSGTFRTLMEENPQWRDTFADFTYFPNTVGCYTYTRHAIPYILTGKWMENQEPYASFQTKAMDESPLFSMLEEQGYRMGMYEPELTYENEHIYRFENIHDGYYRLDSIGEFARQNFFTVWFQYMPYQLKPLLSHEDMISNIQHRAVGSTDAFTYENDVFLDAVRNTTFTTVDENCFRFIHLDGAHVPFRYDKDANVIPLDQGSYEQNVQAAITVTDAFLTKLRDTGVYDNSAIIVMADHGYTEVYDSLLGRSNPFLMIKGVKESHPLTISEQPASYEDLQNIYQMLCDKADSGSLIPYSDNEPRTRRFLSYDYNTESIISEYFQDGYASDFNRLKASGNVYYLND